LITLHATIIVKQVPQRETQLSLPQSRAVPICSMTCDRVRCANQCMHETIHVLKLNGADTCCGVCNPCNGDAAYEACEDKEHMVKGVAVHDMRT
jgi:hypothetical protein